MVGAFLQTEQRRRAEASRKAVETAAEAKQEADIAAYHAQLRDKEAHKHHQHSLGREEQPAGKPPPPLPSPLQHQHTRCNVCYCHEMLYRTVAASQCAGNRWQP